MPQTTKIPNCRSSWGFWVRYKGLPGCLSAYELCVYCSCCTSTLSHLRLSQGMWQTAGNQNLIPAVLDGGLWCSHKRRKSTDIIVICKKGFYIVGVNTVLVIKNNLNYPIYFATRLVLYHFRGQIMWCSSACVNMGKQSDTNRAFLHLFRHRNAPFRSQCTDIIPRKGAAVDRKTGKLSCYCLTQWSFGAPWAPNIFQLPMPSRPIIAFLSSLHSFGSVSTEVIKIGAY